MKSAKARVAVTVVLLTICVTLAGCAEEFAVREKGVYPGPADQPLDEATRRQLHDRSQLQSYN